MNDFRNPKQERDSETTNNTQIRVPVLIDLDSYEVVDPKSGCDVETQPFASDDDPWEEYEVVDPKSGREVETQPFAGGTPPWSDMEVIAPDRTCCVRGIMGWIPGGTGNGWDFEPLDVVRNPRTSLDNDDTWRETT